MKAKVLLIIVLLVTSISLVAYADNSLWSDQASDVYNDRQEFEIGDIITILIEEDADAVQSANTSTSQDSNVDADAGLGIFSFIDAFSFGYSDEDNADGATQRSGTLRADITTQISDILPNGNFRVIGSKRIKINDEEQIIKLTGIIRPGDISLDNTISSKLVAEANIEYEGQGAVADKQKPGLLGSIFNWLF